MALYYTQEEMRDVITYARDRGIRVVPEFDMPGHSTAWFVGPSRTGQRKRTVRKSNGSGESSIRRWTDQREVYKFLDELIARCPRFFRTTYFHIGGDEVNGKEWDANPKIQAFMKAHGIKNNEALQAYFSGRVQEAGDQARENRGWLGRSAGSGSAEGYRDPVVARASFAGAAAKQGYRGFCPTILLDLDGPRRGIMRWTR